MQIPTTDNPMADAQATVFMPRADGRMTGNQRPAGSGSKPPVRAPQPAVAAVRVSRRELLSFASQLAIMTRSGVDVASSLESLARQNKRIPFRKLIQQVHFDVTSGLSLSDALAKHEAALGATFTASVAAGEASGQLSDVLNQFARLVRSEIRLRNTLRTMLTYPALLLSVSSLVLIALVMFVLPQFAEIFAQYETPLPAITSLLLAVATELRTRFWLWGGLLVAAVAGGVVMCTSSSGRRMIDNLLLNTRVLRDVTRSLLIGRTCRLLSIMICNGVPVLDSLRLAKATIRNSLYQELFARLENDVLNGRGLGVALLAAEFVPPGAAEMIATAEQTGDLGGVTQLLGEYCEEEAETRLRELVTLLEPAIILGMGFLVAIVVLAVMLPMFDLATLAQKG